jgi:hypothetical protein
LVVLTTKMMMMTTIMKIPSWPSLAPETPTFDPFEIDDNNEQQHDELQALIPIIIMRNRQPTDDPHGNRFEKHVLKGQTLISLSENHDPSKKDPANLVVLATVPWVTAAARATAIIQVTKEIMIIIIIIMMMKPGQGRNEPLPEIGLDECNRKAIRVMIHHRSEPWQDAKPRENRARNVPRENLAKNLPRENLARNVPRENHAKKDPERKDPRDKPAKNAPRGARNDRMQRHARNDPKGNRVNHDPRENLARKGPADPGPMMNGSPKMVIPAAKNERNAARSKSSQPTHE